MKNIWLRLCQHFQTWHLEDERNNNEIAIIKMLPMNNIECKENELYKIHDLYNTAKINSRNLLQRDLNDLLANCRMISIALDLNYRVLRVRCY